MRLYITLVAKQACEPESNAIIREGMHLFAGLGGLFVLGSVRNISYIIDGIIYKSFIVKTSADQKTAVRQTSIL